MFAATFLLWGGCKHTRAPLLEVPFQPRNPTELAGVLKEMAVRRAAIRTVVTRLDLVFYDHVKNRKLGLNGFLFGGADGDMRLRISNGDAVVMDLSYRGNEVSLYLPKRERFFRGSRKEVLESNGNILALLAHVGTVADLFFPRLGMKLDAIGPARSELGFDLVTAAETEGGVRRETRRLYISRMEPVCSRLVVLDRTEHAMGSVVYADYRFPAPSGSSKPDAAPQPVHPRQVTLSTADNERALEMTVQEIILQEAPIPKAKFELNPPAELPIRSLSEQLKSSKGLWD
ncbi:MAG: hypothetical protein HS116_28865 [Planctomycetes bacterium]|nr:hypothetical protein [Planctomycetota bacterium]